jgi:hypothetical protein
MADDCESKVYEISRMAVGSAVSTGSVLGLSALGGGVADWIKNQPWNINVVSQGFNRWLGKYPLLAPLDAPSWAVETVAGAGTAIGAALTGNNCDCQ